MTVNTNNIEIDPNELIEKLTDLEKLSDGDVARVIELLLLENHILEQNQSSGMLRRRNLDFSNFPRFLQLTELNEDDVINT